MAYYDDVNSSRMLSSSISSLASSRPHSNYIAKAYRQAAQLFLTRRLPEALSTIEPIITPPPLDYSNGETPAFAPVATASRGTRVKVWSFYLTFLNSVVELGAEEGKHAFGSTRWKQLVSKCRDGSVWEEVVRDGYGGVEGDVDAEVVVNLATLLLTHSPSQRLNQQRLETYLSASAHPNLDISTHMSSPSYLSRRNSAHLHTATGTSTPRDLNTRLKLLELYTLHVLPRNEEWDYARDFIQMSEVLDDERKEAFLQALAHLKDEKEEAEIREAHLRQQQQEQMERARKESEARRLEASRAEDERRKREEENRRQPRGSDDAFRRPAHGGGLASPPARASRPPAKKNSQQPPPGLYYQLSSMMTSMQALALRYAQRTAANPLRFFRFCLFMVMFAIAFGRRDFRERIMRILRNAMDKVKRTVGMGVKVSYI